MLEDTLKEGEWIVHKQYGIGQIRGVEEKKIGGKARSYFRVRITGGVYWLPTKKVPDYVRFVASKYKLYKTLRAIKEKPVELPKNYKQRNNLVAERSAEATLQATGELIRDLHGRKREQGGISSIVDERQLTNFRQQFIREMAVILDIDTEDAEAKLDKALAESQSKANE